MTAHPVKRNLIRIAAVLAAVVFTMSSCSAPPPHETQTLKTPVGAVGLNMTRKQIEKFYEMQYELETEGGPLIDYGPVVVVYDNNGWAVSVRAFEPGITTSTGVEVGMAYADVLAKSPEWAVELTVNDDPAIRVDYQGKGEKPESAVKYSVLYRFADGVVERMIIGYPGHTTE